MRLLFLGTPEFAVPSLDAMLEGPDDLVGVVSQPDRPRGRGLAPEAPPVVRRAREAGTPVFQHQKLHGRDSLASLRELNPDLGITCAFGRILRPSLLGLPRFGCINVHASLLPRHRGAAPIQWTILNGDPWTGITIFQLDEGMDTGPVLLQLVERVSPTDDAGSLSQRLAKLGGSALLEACKRIREQSAVFLPQDESGATYARRLTKEDGICSFARPADQVERFVRAMSPWPGALTVHKGSTLRLGRVEPFDLLPHGVPAGQVLAVDSDPVIATRPGAIRLLRVQSAGKKMIEGDAWARGTRLAVGDRLG